VTGGKGGVGKTSISINLALCLRLFGKSVMLVDADLGLADVDVLLGLNVERTLKDVILKGSPVEDAVVEGPYGLKILPGASGVEEMVRLGEEARQQFLQQIQQYCMNMDVVVVDTSPGIHSPVVDCLVAADQIVLVTSPEPMALTDAYALLKVINAHSVRKRISILVNKAQSREEAVRTFDRLRVTAERFLGLDVEYLGSLSRDEAVLRASKQQRDFLTHYAGSEVSRDLRKIAARLLSAGSDAANDLGRFFRQIIS